MTDTTTPAIACRNLWQVFGPGADKALTDALSRSGNDADKAAADLRENGFIPAVQDANFEVRDGELFVIMGLSGSGKSTLIRCISQLLPGTGGEIRVDGENVIGASKKADRTAPQKTGHGVPAFRPVPAHDRCRKRRLSAARSGRGRKKERLARAQEVISLVGLEGREDSFPRQLSGGQRQRVGIARSLAVNPDIWFLDEPFSALDPLIRRQLQDEFLRIQATLKKSIVFITHDIQEALKLADRIAIMRDGKIVQIGTPTDIVLRPVDDYVREFSKDVAKGQHAKVASVMRERGRVRPGRSRPDHVDDTGRGPGPLHGTV